ncbi:unnamed protein product, partial [Mesorhabditis spiculigera]
MSTYAEKAAYGAPPTGYPVASYDASSEFYRQQQQPTYITPNAYPQFQGTYGAQGFAVTPFVVPQQGVYNYPIQDQGRMAFNPTAPPPQAPQHFSRPPPGKEDQYQGGIAVFDTSAQPSAAYTASWVSSTSSIRADMAEPAPHQMVGEFGQWNNPEQTNDPNALPNAYAQAMDQFGKMQIVDPQNYENQTGGWVNPEQQIGGSANLNQTQWPGLDQANEKKESKRVERERRQRASPPPKDMTWEERLKRAQGAKERAENPRPFDPTRPVRGTAAPGRGGFRGGSTAGARGGRRGSNEDLSEGRGRRSMNGGVIGEEVQQGGYQSSGPGGRGGIANAPTVQYQNPMMYGGRPQPHNMVPPMQYPYNQYNNMPMQPMAPQQQPQDQKFRNTWLDVSLFVVPYPNFYQGMQQDFGIRGRGRGRGMPFRGGRTGRKPSEGSSQGMPDAENGSDTPQPTQDQPATPPSQTPTENTEKPVPNDPEHTEQ